MRVAIVGAGVAGLTAGVALQRDGHEVRIYEQASELRTDGFGLNLWTNAGSLLAALGVDIPGEPYDHIAIRSGGRQRGIMSLPTPGEPHRVVDRGALLRAIHGKLRSDTVRLNTPVSDSASLLAEGADLVVAADGVGSRLRPDITGQQRTSKPWPVWQVVFSHADDLLEERGCVFVLGRGTFYGLFRLPNNQLCWFLEDPSLSLDASAADVLTRVRGDEDPLVREFAERTPVERLGQWLARDRRPTRGIIGDRVVAIGDAAHPMLPCIGQGACTSIEDGIALTLALRAGSVADALRRYRGQRLPVTVTRVATAHFACALRRPGIIASAIASAPVSASFVAAAAVWMRMLNRPNRRVMRQLTSAGGKTSSHR